MPNLKLHFFAACALMSLMVVGAPTPALATFYKCIGADGSTTYNDTPCAATENTQLLSSTARVVQAVDCRIARNFTVDAVVRMRQDDTAEDIFNAYGGAQKLTASSRDLISYVYKFKSNTLASSQYIVDLTIERCQAGFLGDALGQCATFPKEFIKRFGSCVKARQVNQTVRIQPTMVESDVQSTGSGNSDEPALGYAEPVKATDPTAEPIVQQSPPDQH